MTDTIISAIESQRIVPVIRVNSGKLGRGIVDALYCAGVRVVELTTSIPDVFHIVRDIRQRYADVVVGVGTLHDGELARRAAENGAQLLVTYKVCEAVAEAGREYGVPYILGGATPTEIARCMDLGSAMVKIFPADTLGLSFLRELHGPMPEAKIFPTGGIALKQVVEWLDAGAAAVGVGSALTRVDPVQNGLALLTNRVHTLLEELGVDYPTLTQ